MRSKPGSKVKPQYDRIPSEVELFGRKIQTIDETERLTLTKNFGEARYGINKIALNRNNVSSDELKLTYLHEMLHFILNFTGYQELINKSDTIDLEQFIELLSSGIYQYEKSAKFL